MPIAMPVHDTCCLCQCIHSDDLCAHELCTHTYTNICTHKQNQGGQDEAERSISSSDDRYIASVESQQGLRARVSTAASGMAEANSYADEESSSSIAHAGEKAD